jgi:hypothetical protein
MSTGPDIHLGRGDWRWVKLRSLKRRLGRPYDRHGSRADVTLPRFASGSAITMGKRHRPEASMSGRVLLPTIPYGKPGATHGHPMIRIGTAATDQANRICIAPNVLWLCRSKCFLPPISKDKRGSVRQRGPRARIQVIGDTGDRLIGVHPCLSAAKNACSGQSIASGRRVGISNAITLSSRP